MMGMAPPWANFLAGANDKMITPPTSPRTSYGAPQPTKVAKPSSPAGPNVGRMTRDPNGIPTPNMGILPPLFNPNMGQVY